MFSPPDTHASLKFSAGMGEPRIESIEDPNSMSGMPTALGSIDLLEPDGKSMNGGRRKNLMSLIKTTRMEQTLFKLAFVAIFIFYRLKEYSYNMDLITEWLGIILDPIRAVHTYRMFVIGNIITLLLVFTIVTIVAVVILTMQRQAKVPIIALRVLRFLSALVLTALIIPIATFLAIGVHCVDGIMPKFGNQCYSLPHLALYVFNIFGLIVFVPMTVVGIVLFIDISPTSKSPVARAHARVDLHDIVARIVLVFLDIASYNSSKIYQWVYMSVSALWLFFLSYKMSCTQPYYSPVTTAFRSGMTMATSSSMIASMVIRGILGFDIMDNWVYIIPVSILGFIFGVLMTHVHSHHFLRRTIRKWHHILREEQASANEQLYANLTLPSFLPGNKDITQVQLRSPIISKTKVMDGTGTLPAGGTLLCSAVKKSSLPFRHKSGISIVGEPFNNSVLPVGAQVALRIQDSDHTHENDTSNPAVLKQVFPCNIDSMACPIRQIKSSAKIIDVPGNDPSDSAMPAHNYMNGHNIDPVVTPLSHVKPSPRIIDDSGNEITSAFSGLKRSPTSRFGISKAKVVLPPSEDSEKIVSGLANGTSGDVFLTVTEKDPPLQQCVFDSPIDVEVCIRFIRKNPSVKKITIGLQLLERGLLEYPNNPLLLLLAATYLTIYYGKPGAKVADQLMKLLGTAKTSVPVDVKYLVYCREQAALDAGVDVIDRVATYALERDARWYHLRALRAMRDVWETIQSQSSTAHLANKVTRLASFRWSASNAYQKLLARKQKDKNILRQYAMFLTSIEGDIVQAKQIIERADEVETYNVYQQGINEAKTQSMVNDYPNGKEDMKMPPFANHVFLMGSEVGVIYPGNESQQFDDAVKTYVSHAAGARAPSVHGSETSGTSTTRANCQKAGLCLQLYQRLTQPLMAASTVSILAVLFICSLIAGFVVCLNLIQKTTNLLKVELFESRKSRGALQYLIEGIRAMVYANEVQSPSKFNAAYSLVSNNLQYLLRVGLPIVNLFDNESITDVKKFRFFYGTVTAGNRLDYQPIIKNAIQFANYISQIAALALNYKTYGNLTAAKFVQIPEFWFITDNLSTIEYAINELITTAVDFYNVHASRITIQIIVIMGLALLLLGSLALMIHRQIVCQYFLREAMVHSLLMSLKKHNAAKLVANFGEEIESYSELVYGDNDESEFDMGDNRLTGGSGEEDSYDKGSGVHKDATDSCTRQLRYYILLYTYVVVVAAIIISLFTVTLTSLNVQRDLTRMVHSLNRHFYSNSIRIIGREYVSPDRTLTPSTVLQNFRSSIFSAELVHAKLINEPNGLGFLMPNITVQPRNCSTGNFCANLIEIPEVGFTRRIAEMPLDVEYLQMLDIATRLCNSNITTDPDGFNLWLLLEALTLDVGHRISHVDDTYCDILQNRVEHMGQWIIVTFVLLIIVSLAACFALFAIGIMNLKRDALVLITLLYTLPTTMVKESPEIMAFMDTGGLILMNA